MKGHPAAEGHFQGAVVEPAPSGRQARHECTILVRVDEVLEDVQHHGGPVIVMGIDDPHFPAWLRNLFLHARVPPPQGDDHEQEATNDELFHVAPYYRTGLQTILSTADRPYDTEPSASCAL